VPGLPDDAYFAQVARDLTAAGLGTPQILIDLDRLEANSDAIVGDIGRDRYRIVEKSLPSLDVLGHIRERTGADRFLVLHLPFLPDILRAFPTAQVLVGKPQPIAAVGQFFQRFDPAEWPAVAARVRFLADTPARANELVALAARLGLLLQVGVENDVGLPRGGIRYPSGLGAVLAPIVAAPTRARFAAVLGYDGHTAFAPAPPGLEEYTVRATHRTIEATFRAFLDVLRADFPALITPDLVINSGGSSSYPLFRGDGGPVNDVATGGANLRPASYPALLLGALRPAIFIAAPVIARFEAFELPYLSNASRGLYHDRQAFTIYGGGWAAEFVSPAGVDLAPIESDPENQNLVPNQAQLLGPTTPVLAPGDWIFQLPRQSDAMFQFQDILLVRGGRLQSALWHPFPRRY
jgi:D-serine deaminase-like pyridoxal phosphate-dependent protein